MEHVNSFLKNLQKLRARAKNLKQYRNVLLQLFLNQLHDDESKKNAEFIALRF